MCKLWFLWDTWWEYEFIFEEPSGDYYATTYVNKHGVSEVFVIEFAGNS